MQDLDSNVPLVPEVMREIDGRHATGAELTLDAIAIGERASQPDRNDGSHFPRASVTGGSGLVDSGKCIRSRIATKRASRRKLFLKYVLLLMYGIQMERVVYARSSSRNAASVSPRRACHMARSKGRSRVLGAASCARQTPSRPPATNARRNTSTGAPAILDTASSRDRAAKYFAVSPTSRYSRDAPSRAAGKAGSSSSAFSYDAMASAVRPKAACVKPRL